MALSPKDLRERLGVETLSEIDLPRTNAALADFIKTRPELVDAVETHPVIRNLWRRIFRTAYLKGLYAGRREMIERVESIGGTFK